MQLTIQQAAALLQVSESQLHRWIRDRGVPAVLFNEQYRLNRVGLMDWAQRNQIPIPALDIAEGTPAVHLRELLARGGIHRGIQGGTRQEAVAAAVDQLVLPPSVDREFLREMILARAAHDSTPIGNGIALPHARYPFVVDVAEPILGLFFLATPTDFRALDREPVFALFVLVSPTTRLHLHVLSRVARALGGELGKAVRARAGDTILLEAARASDVAAGQQP